MGDTGYCKTFALSCMSLEVKIKILKARKRWLVKWTNTLGRKPGARDEM
jgi:hypothetical protein